MIREFAGYIPDIGETIETKVLSFEGRTGKLEVEVPHLSPEQLKKVMTKVKKASSEKLKTYSVAEIIDIIAKAIDQLLNRHSVYRKKAEELLPIVTGYDAEMIRLGLTTFFKTFRKPQLQRFLVEDFGNPILLDDFQPRVKGGFSKAFGPELIGHVWAGNVPGLPLWSFISGLLVKSGTIGKVSSAEPLMAGWFARQLAEVEPDLADCFAVVWWKGGDEEREKCVFETADAVVGYGGNSSLEAMKSRIPLTTRFLPFGHKVSFGVVMNSSLDPRKAWDTAHQAALDIVRFDQQGCYSPHLFYVQTGGSVSPLEFARSIAYELDCFEKRYPLRQLGLEEKHSIAAWRNQEELQLFSSSGKEIISNAAANWTVVFEGDALSFRPSCLNRTVRVLAFDQPDQVFNQISPYRNLLQTIGVAGSPNELFKLAEMFGKAGGTRITALGNMTTPEAGWHHDGRFNLLDLVQIVDIEQAAEEYAEKFAPYAD
ncbi:acyl-CoA reductase [Mesobacillus maritimus]|uniref:acyl-CoA reductase n=1 Tax=Mesobacillus maritimus TaxID=1643336 RepID=UPI0038504F69